jgi:type IV pilus assembly protein PilA
MSKHTTGFSLIEIMIVIAIMGVLSAIAIPSYENYIKRARFTEVIAATEPFKTAIAIALQTGIPATELNSGKNGIPTTPPSTKNLAQITVKNGVIIASGTGLVDNKTYVLEADNSGSAWKASGTCVKAALCNA